MASIRPSDLPLGQAHLKGGPFTVGDLVLMQRPQTLKGHSPFVGPFWVNKVLGRYTYLLSNGQKWNLRLLKCFMPPAVTWSESLGAPPPIREGTVGTKEPIEGSERPETVQDPHRYPE